MHPAINKQIPDFITVHVHRSQFPEQLDLDLLRCLDERWVDSKFHYLSNLQMRRWLALSQSYAPVSQDQDCQVTYDRCFSHLARQFQDNSIHVIGLGCGAGQKDARVLASLGRKCRQLRYSACDSSLPMVLAARQSACDLGSVELGDSLVCDLGSSPDLNAFFRLQNFECAACLYLCFGVLPNFEPDRLFGSIQGWMKPEDYLLLGANLVPEFNTDAELVRILAQYDNDLTRHWLLTFFEELGVEPSQVSLEFSLGRSQKYPHPRRIIATAIMEQSVRFHVGNRTLITPPRCSIQLFFSCRYTKSQVLALLRDNRLAVLEDWVASSGQEGLFLCRLNS